MAKQKPILGNSDDQNFSVKVLLDQILEEGKTLPPSVKEHLRNARMECWKEHEKKHKPPTA